jgi:hypothetical protein
MNKNKQMGIDRSGGLYARQNSLSIRETRSSVLRNAFDFATCACG